nr:hypothetical protein Iba_scaffold5942CG0310 [Ipomoea batatas]
MDSESRSACKLQQKDANSDVFKMLGKDLVFGLSLNSPVEIAQSCTAISDFIEDLKYIKFGDVVSRESGKKLRPSTTSVVDLHVLQSTNLSQCVVPVVLPAHDLFKVFPTAISVSILDEPAMRLSNGI